MIRRQLPAHSPLPLRAVIAAVAAKLGMRRHAATEVVNLLQEHYGPKRVLLTASGTTALELAIAACRRLHPGAPVALPAYSCYDLATAADGADAPVLLYDLDPLTLGPEMDSLARALDNGARTVVVAHLYGVPVELERVRQLTDNVNALVIEDAAQSLGVQVNGRTAGASGSFGVLSFGRGKGVTAGGGGALITNDDDGVRALDAAGARPLGNGAFGWSRLVPLTAQWLLGRPSLYGIPASIPMLRLGETIYHDPVPPARMGTAACAVLSITWPLAAPEMARRRMHAKRLLSRMSASEVMQACAAHASSEPGFLRLPALLSPSWRAHADTQRARRLGIMPGYPIALSDLTGFRSRCRNAGGEFAGARTLARQLVTLPTHGRLTERDLRALEAWIVNAGRATGVGER